MRLFNIAILVRSARRIMRSRHPVMDEQAGVARREIGVLRQVVDRGR